MVSAFMSAAFQFGELFSGSGKQRPWYPRQFGDMYSVTSAGGTFYYFMEKDYVAVLFTDVYIEIFYPSYSVFKYCKLMIMSSEQSSYMSIFVAQIFAYCPGDGKSVISTGTPSDLI